LSTARLAGTELTEECVERKQEKKNSRKRKSESFRGGAPRIYGDERNGTDRRMTTGKNDHKGKEKGKKPGKRDSLGRMPNKVPSIPERGGGEACGGVRKRKWSGTGGHRGRGRVGEGNATSRQGHPAHKGPRQKTSDAKDPEQ